MRDYGRVYSSFWQSPETRALSEDARTLALYLLTSPHANLIGFFRLPDAYAADDLQWPSERVSEGFHKLAEKGFLARDDGSKWVFICKYLKWNAFENANVAKAAAKAFDQAPKSVVKSLMAKALLEFGEHLSAEFRTLCEGEAGIGWNPSRTLPKPFANPEPEPEPEPEPFQNQSLNQNQAGTSFDAPRSGDASPPIAEVVPIKAKPPKAPAPTSGAWAAYAEAYRLRYQVDPVRNATVNGQMAQLVARLGADEAPEVARFFLAHRGAFYVKAMHSVGTLLADCEKLRTEWATGQQMTHAQAVAADKTQTNLNAFGPLIRAAQAREALERESQHG